MSKEADGVVFAIKEKGRDRFLTELRTRPGSIYFGKIIIPGGTIDENETSEEALRREVLEECGVTISEFEQLGNFILNRPGKSSVEAVLYRIDNYEGQIKNVEIAKSLHLFLPLSSMKRLCHEVNLEMVEAIQRSLSTPISSF